MQNVFFIEHTSTLLGRCVLWQVVKMCKYIGEDGVSKIVW